MFHIGQHVQVALAGGDPMEFPAGAPVRDLPGSDRAPDGLPILAALVNNDVVSLSYPLETDSRVDFLTIRHRQGWRIYRNTASFLLAKTVHELFPGAAFAVEHSLGNGYYCSFKPAGGPATEEDLRRIEAAMHDLAQRDVPIVRRKISYSQALATFSAEQQTDKADLLRYRNPPYVTLYDCEGFSDLAHGVLADRAGA
ncbi:MAG: hypothetical protein U1E27_10315, partial [Kiritimatiellia bacterium]|nr:hypothetical protein [Kiritimatiellia bacterium]